MRRYLANRVLVIGNGPTSLVFILSAALSCTVPHGNQVLISTTKPSQYWAVDPLVFRLFPRYCQVSLYGEAFLANAKLLPVVKNIVTFIRSPTWITAGFAQSKAGPGGTNFECRGFMVP